MRFITNIPVFAGRVAGKAGRTVISSAGAVSELFGFSLRLFSLFVSPGKAGRGMLVAEIVEQIYFSAVMALPVTLFVAFVTGGLLMGQFALLSGKYDLGRISVMLIIRELGPMLTAMVVILRSATSVAIEIGYMKIYHEIEALEMSGIDPLLFLGLPRLIGIVAATVLLFAAFAFAAIFGGGILSWVTGGLNTAAFIVNFEKAITGMDIFVGMIKALCFGIAVGIICLRHGFKAEIHIRYLSRAVYRAVVESFVACLAIGAIISVVFYM